MFPESGGRLKEGGEGGDVFSLYEVGHYCSDLLRAVYNMQILGSV